MFLRGTRAAYTQIMTAMRDIATGLSAEIANTGPFELVSDGNAIPVFAYKLKYDIDHYSVFGVSDKLREECAYPFGVTAFDHRLLHGGLPEALLAEHKAPAFFNEWIDSFYARDILELFGIRNRQGFLSLFRLLLRQSGRQLDYSQLANLSGLSRPTVKAHIEAIQIAHAVHLLRPFHGGASVRLSAARNAMPSIQVSSRCGDLVFTICTTKDLL